MASRYPPLKPLKVSNVGLRIRYSPFTTPFKYEEDVLSNLRNPDFPKVKDRIEQLPKSELRWKIVTDVSVKALPKATRRNWLKRRWIAALIQALAARGFKSSGHAKEGGAAQSLQGTLELLVYEGYGFDAPFAKLVKRAGSIVEAIEEEHKKNVHNG